MIPDATRRFLSAAAALGLQVEPVVHPDGTKTAADAAAAVGCDVSAIVKTLVFMADDEPVLVLMSGDRMVDLGKLAGLRDTSDVRRAGLDEVRTHTGYAAGGTPPVGHATPMDVYADESLRRNDQVWAAAGTPTTVFPIALEVLVSVTKATWVDVAQ
jgi:Cys-tRNA(Pro) deacylase